MANEIDHQNKTLKSVRSVSGINISEDLRDRWNEKNAEGITHRDAVLKELQLRKNPPRDLRGIALIDQDLRNQNFSGCALAGANFTGTRLCGSKFFKSDLRGANLAKAHIENCEFLGANLSGADLNECIGEDASFGRADLTEVNFFRAKLQGATFSRGNLHKADVRVSDLQGAKMHKADLTEVDFTRANLRGADLSESDVAGATFIYADLRQARLKRIERFESAEWLGADIHEMDLYGAYRVRRFIMDESYLHEFRSQSRFKAILYWLWWLTSNCGRSFLRWAICTAFVVAIFAALYRLVDVDFGMHDPDLLTCIYFSVVTITTLGYGDIVPASNMAKILVIIEVVLGYLTLGGLISILANKMARRAD